METAFNLDPKFLEGFAALEAHAKADYDRFVTGMCNSLGTSNHTEKYSLRLSFGKKFAKIIKQRNGKDESAFGFVALVNGESQGMSFKVGDLLKSDGWKSPAFNFVRGNLLDKTFDRVRWTSIG